MFGKEITVEELDDLIGNNIFIKQISKGEESDHNFVDICGIRYQFEGKRIARTLLKKYKLERI